MNLTMLIHTFELNLSAREVKLIFYIGINLSKVQPTISCPNQLTSLLTAAISNPAWLGFKLVIRFHKTAHHSLPVTWVIPAHIDFPFLYSFAWSRGGGTKWSLRSLPTQTTLRLVSLHFRHTFCILLIAGGMPAPLSSPISSSPNKFLGS